MSNDDWHEMSCPILNFSDENNKRFIHFYHLKTHLNSVCNTSNINSKSIKLNLTKGNHKVNNTKVHLELIYQFKYC